MLADQMRAALERRRARGTLRALVLRDTTARRAHPPTSDTELDRAPVPLVDFSSNDYLSLASCAEMREAFVARVQAMAAGESERGGRGSGSGSGSSSGSLLGSTGSRLLDGNSLEHEELEARLAAFFRAPAALFFGSGFEANVSLFSTLPQPDDLVLYDELIHASVHDGMRQSRAAPERRVAFRHNDLAHLERILEAYCRPADPRVSGPSSSAPQPADTDADADADSDAARFATSLRQRRANVFIAVEAVYSMDGDLCPLPALVRLAQRFVPRDCLHVIVDEAHSTATYGPQGRGLCVGLGQGLDDVHEGSGVRVRLATFGKACGASGAVVLCAPLVRSYLVNYARPFIFSTAPPQAVLMAAHAAIDMLERADVGDARRDRVVRVTRALVDGLRDVVDHARRGGGDEARSGERPLLALVPSLAGDAGAVPGEDPHVRALPASPIVPLLTPHARPLSAHLQARGFLVRPITYPTVPLGQDRVRICVHADNTEEEVQGLCAAVREWVDGVRRASLDTREEPACKMPTSPRLSPLSSTASPRRDSPSLPTAPSPTHLLGSAASSSPSPSAARGSRL